jgi:hypothetical protein
MASSKTIFKNFSGKLGNQFVLKQYGDKSVLSKYPDMSKRKLSPKQKKINLLMKKANKAAKGIMANTELRNAEQLRLNVTSNKLYTALIRDFFKTALAAEANTGAK